MRETEESAATASNVLSSTFSFFSPSKDPLGFSFASFSFCSLSNRERISDGLSKTILPNRISWIISYREIRRKREGEDTETEEETETENE